MVAAVGEESVPMEHPPLSDRTKDKPGDELADSEQATLATTLAMLAHGSNPGYMLAQLQQHDTAECTETSDDRQLLAKRDGSTAGLSDLRDSSKQQRFGDAEDSGTPPDSPLSATAAAAAAAGLHKLSSASAVGFDAALGSFAVSEDGIQHVGHPHSGDGLDHIAVAGGGNPKSTPIQIMQQLVDCGILPSCGPETHCYVKCGMVQGVFSLASGTILCLCDACSENGQGEPTWFAPAAFERHGGMAASKKWRGSIQVGTSLHGCCLLLSRIVQSTQQKLPSCGGMRTCNVLIVTPSFLPSNARLCCHCVAGQRLTPAQNPGSVAR